MIYITYDIANYSAKLLLFTPNGILHSNKKFPLISVHYIPAPDNPGFPLLDPSVYTITSLLERSG